MVLEAYTIVENSIKETAKGFHLNHQLCASYLICFLKIEVFIGHRCSVICKVPFIPHFLARPTAWFPGRVCEAGTGCEVVGIAA